MPSFSVVPHFKKSLSYSLINTKSKMIRTWVQTCIFYLLLTATLGLLLRWLIIYPIPGVSFRYLQHTHSHIAFMGWVFNAFFVAIILGYFKNEPGILKSFHKLFIFLQISVIGMLATFPFQGYGLFSIAFSTLHTILAFWFVIKFLLISRKNNLRKNPSYKYLLAGFIFLAISALGPLALGIISAQGMKDSDWYDLAIYFFLHFQYNGWFLFVVFALFFQTIEHIKLSIPKDSSRAAEFFKRFRLVRYDDYRGAFKSLFQNCASLLVKLDVSGRRHAFVNQINVEIQRQHKRKTKPRTHALAIRAHRHVKIFIQPAQPAAERFDIIRV